MICFDRFSAGRPQSLALLARFLCVLLTLGAVLTVTACGNKDKKAGQALASVNGEEITMLQINDELVRAGIRPEQQEAATGKLLETLIDRQLILQEAMRNDIDRTTGVMQSIERAKAQIITQAYVKSLEAQITKPTPAEVADYFQKHPEYFSQRKQYDVQQLVIATRDFSKDLKSVVDSARSLEEIAAWMDGHNVHYGRGQMSRHTTDMPETIATKLRDMRKGQLFIVNEGENSMINIIGSIKDSPVPVNIAAPQIEQYLFNEKLKEAAKAEIAHLRSSAKIEYLNAPAPDAAK